MLNMQCEDCGNKFYSASPNLVHDTPCEACGGEVRPIKEEAHDQAPQGG